MDDRQFDNLLKGKLEGFQDKAPVNMGAMQEMMKGLKAVSSSTPWYVSLKPLLIPSLTSLAAGITIFFLIWTSAEKPSLDDDEIFITQIDSTKSTDSKNLNESAPENKEEQEVEVIFGEEKERIVYSDQALIKSEGRLNENKIIRSKETSISKRNHQLVVEQRNSVVNSVVDSVANSVKLDDPGMSWKSLQLTGVNFSLNPLIEVPSISPIDISEMGKSTHTKSLISGFRVGLTSRNGVVNPDFGKPKPVHSQGVALEVGLGARFRLATGISFMRRNYHINHPERLRPDELRRFPRIPDLTVNRVARIKTSAQALRVPASLKYVSGNPSQRVRLLAGAGVVGAKVFTQKFTYEKPTGEYYPEGKTEAPSSVYLAAFQAELGTELRLHEKSVAQISVYYDHSINQEGVERRKFNSVGISGTILFGQTL